MQAKPIRKPRALRRRALVTLDTSASSKTRIDFGNTIGEVDEIRLGVTRGLKVTDNPCGAPSTAAW
jgi:hypothetical protein